MKLHQIPLYILAIGGLLLNSCKNDKKAISPTEVTFKKEGELKLFQKPNDSLIKELDIEIADDDYQRQTGLMYRESMKNNHGMLFIFQNDAPRWFYMKNTNIPLDIIYIDKNQKIVSIQKDAKPLDETSLPSEYPARYVLEVNAGLSESWELKAGDSISFTTM